MSRLLCFIPVAAAAAVYFPICSGYFATDDFINLYSIVNDDRLEYLLRPHSSHLLLTRNALFVLFHALFGLRAELYFAVVLATHLLNVLLVYRIVWAWTGASSLAVLGATLWGTSPVQAGALEWYSVYGQVVVATLLLVLLDRAARIAPGAAPPRSAYLVWPLLLVAAGTSFGNGIALALVSPIVAYLLLPPSRGRWGLCAVLLLLALGTMPAYRALLAWHAGLSGSTLGVYLMSITMGGLGDRLTILQMLGYLLSYGVTSLVLGFAGPAVRFPGAASVIITSLCAAGLLATLVRASAEVRRRIVALCIIAVASYAIIAAGRAMYARGDVAAAAARARYHYVSTAPVAILLCLILRQLPTPAQQRKAVHTIILLLWLGSALVLHARARPFINLHQAARREVEQSVASIRAAIDGTPPRQEVHIPNRPFKSIGPMLGRRSEFPGWAALFVISFPANQVDGRRVRFVDDDAALVQIAQAGKRTHDLFVLSGAPARPGATVP